IAKILSPRLYESQNPCYDLLLVGMRPPDAWPLGERTWSRGAPRRTPRAQPDGQVEGEADFFIFFACNPLKSPDSEKLMKTNERNFPFICLHLLSFISSEFSLRLHPGRAGR